jgi:hypothetical protein
MFYKICTQACANRKKDKVKEALQGYNLGNYSIEVADQSKQPNH